MHIALVCAAVLAAAPAPFTSATVYGDRARVVRTAEVRLSGAEVVEFPALTDRADVGSVRVEAEGAEVVRVELSRLTSDQLEIAEAKRLLAELERVDADLGKVHQELGAYQEQIQALRNIQPVVHDRSGLAPDPKLDPSGWAAAITFTTDRLAQLQQKSREAEVRRTDLTEQREKLAEEAQRIGGVERRGGWRVLAHVSGQGAAKVHLSYVSIGATWTPRYELQLDPATNQVAVSFFGLVQQDSGEDWGDVGLTLSTARPLQAMAFPKIATWKIGERDRFIPMPAPAPITIRPPPPAPPLPRLEERSEAERLRAQLAAKVGTGAYAAAPVAAPPPPQPQKRRAMPAVPQRSYSGAQGGAPGAAAAMPAAQEPMDYGVAEEDSYEAIAESAPQTIDVGSTTTGVNVSSEYMRNIAVAQTPVAAVGGLSPPPSFRIAPPPPNSPAARAGGYDLAFTSVQRETIPTGKGPRRVALFTERWPVKLERRLFPALSPHAYLAAELKSPSKRVLPGGSAALFVGQDPAGNAELDLVAPGETFTLPLGVDRAVKGVRNVDLVQGEQGFIGKDDVGLYTVTTEVANPYRQPLEVRIHDQWPLKGNEHVELKLTKVEPAPIAQNDDKGTLEWKVTIPPGAKAKVSFTYSLKRPKNWRLEQRQEVAP